MSRALELALWGVVGLLTTLGALFLVKYLRDQGRWRRK